MTAPLYRGAMEEAARAFQPKPSPSGPVWGGNAGLWFDKFCDRWQADFGGLDGDDAKRQWIESLIRPRGRDGLPDANKPPVKAGDPALLAEHARRRRSLVEARGGRVLEMRLTARFASGLGRRHPVENGFAFHHSLGVPFLAGSGVKGLTRAWAEIAAPESVKTIFGPRPGDGALEVGDIILLDALPVEPVSLVADVVTPHTGRWNLADPAVPSSLEPPADWHSPKPIPFLALEAGAVFQFAVLPRRLLAPLDDAARWVSEALEWLGAGAKTATGFGRFQPRDAALPEDPVSPFGIPSAAPRGRGASQPPPPPRRGMVDGEPVEILRREGGLLVVRFLETGDIETVGPDQVT
ncbi:type III-B CRISPR module RAMP protein Cmr6 [Azospirillum soli]|uniref:type III-B CRISPR module RAMP protein Cmr6 n=1 Tax=Azospirillum soli TaxID=1304799 RepID=UPI001AE7CF95|nr:type III-B CRISPR module RAMP protein Cmr6 [Azospirillum soli]MBP2310736.1 CRISPR-associated protein Cmr6 [Azospirillum soli]